MSTFFTITTIIGIIMAIIGALNIKKILGYPPLSLTIIILGVVIVTLAGFITKNMLEEKIGTPVQLISGKYYLPKKVGLDLAIINNKIAKLPEGFNWDEAFFGFSIDKKGEIRYVNKKSVPETED